MGDSWRDRILGGLSQLRYIQASFPFSSKKVFSVILFGSATVFPALPQVDVAQMALEESRVPVPTREMKRDEACLWQRDFFFFTTLLEDKKMLSEQGECQEKSTSEPVPFQVAHDEQLKSRIEELSLGYPIEVMAPAIAEYDREVAALIVGIAKKESNWGKRVPRSPDGADCFNYWGFKGAGSRGTAMGHGCFGSPEEAVHAVGNRITELVTLRKTSEPRNMTIWKCGSSCATHSEESVKKWIADVDLYYRKIVQD